MQILWVAVGFLFFIVSVNVVFDIVGVAATAASEAPFNAMAARKVTGAQEGLALIKNADKVANFANDVVGDISGTVAGALGISIMARVLLIFPKSSELWLNILVTAVIAAVTVAGKAMGKRVAVTRANQVIFLTGRLIARYNRLITSFKWSRNKSFDKKVRKLGRS
ncbi:MAG: hypothetical protein AB1510_03605 [Bacillota bacterium]